MPRLGAPQPTRMTSAWPGSAYMVGVREKAPEVVEADREAVAATRLVLADGTKADLPRPSEKAAAERVAAEASMTAAAREYFGCR